MKQRALAWLILLVGMLWCRGNYFENLVYSTDEAEYAVLADGLQHGEISGLDFLGTTKPPGIALFYRALFDLFGRSMRTLHVAHPFILLAVGVFLVELAIALWGWTAAVPVAVLFWMLANSYSTPDELIALDTESAGLLFLLPALWLAYRYPRRRVLLMLSGALLGLSAMMRQSFVFFALPAAIAFVEASGRRVRRLLLWAAGGVLVWLPLLAVFAARGALGWAWDSWVRYPADYAADLNWAGFLQAAAMNGSEFVVACAPPFILAIVGAVRLGRAQWTGPTRFMAALTLASLLALASGSRFTAHYWYQVFPALSLLGAYAWLSLWRGTRASRGWLVAAVLIGGVIAAVHFPLWRVIDKTAPPKGEWNYPPALMRDEQAAAHYIREHTNPTDGLVVWGYAPQLYFYAHRRPGVRDFICHFITGYSVGAFDPHFSLAPRAHFHPRAEEMFVEDLERNRPPYIIDLSGIADCELTFIQFPILLYPRLADCVRRNYEPDVTIGDIQIYRRRTAAAP